ncbi:phage holin family protein [Demequina sp. SO4-13]|uniref:phage holin family protein n=1 Tax=Demequina sp. SO4-13 TaxID=3401027 RepID=UPI003AF82786
MTATRGRPVEPQDMSTPQLVSQALEDITSLVRDEMALARTEIQEAVRSAALGAGLFSAAGIAALYGGGALVAAAIAGLAVVIAPWLSALIIAVLLFAIAGVAALLGKKKVAAAKPPVDTTTSNVERDIDTVKGVRS